MKKDQRFPPIVAGSRSRLSKLERAVLCQLYGNGAGRPNYTLVAHRLRLPVQDLRRLEAKALRQLRHASPAVMIWDEA